MAEHQHGRVSTAQARWAGLTPKGIAYRIRKGRLLREHRGVFAVGHRSPGPLGRYAAALLACGEGAMLSHWCAAATWNLAPHLTDAVDVTVPRGRMPQRARIRIHRPTAQSGARVHRGLPLTSPARTIADLAPRTTAATLERLLAESMALKLVTHQELRAQRSPRIDVLLAEGPRRTRSDAERALLRLVRRARLPVPETNLHVAGHDVDALWRAQRLVVEVDGFAFHSGRGAFDRDRRRDQALHLAGLRVLRLTWPQLDDEPEATTVLLTRALHQGG